ncbi:MAG: primosomal protein N' [Clostridiaceae bacterium]
MDYVGIVVLSKSISLDKIFTYKIPENLKDSIFIGSRVKIPFGASNKKVDGFVFEFIEEISMNYCKEILSVLDPYPLLTVENIELIKYMKDNYLATYSDCIRVFIPSPILNNMKDKSKKMLFINKKLPEKFYKYPYENIYKLINENKGLFEKNLLSKSYNLSLSSINTMIKHEILIEEDKKINRYNNLTYSPLKELKLNEEQQCAYDKIINSKDKIFLIKGITGSGKTEVYMHLVKKALKDNKSSIILVPEISLTPQMVERFKGRFGKDISVYHSRLSEGEKCDEWKRVKNGEVKVAIGARSAIFLPFKDLGLIILDEEQEASYKSEQNPKYTTVDIAKELTKYHELKVVLGSATPSVEHFYKAQEGEYVLININNRVENSNLPTVHVEDMRKELESGNRTMLSRSLRLDIEKKLINGEQIIIFINRRGHSSFVSCRKCGYVFKCDKCDITLTYHLDENLLKCHYCGIVKKPTRICPKCKSKYVKYFGVGTEKVEKELNKIFPTAKTLRMDYDTTRGKNSYEDIYRTFKEGKADILIGTQMVAKGFHFENVTLVGIIAADLSLNLPDYRAAEKTFQLVTQVSGRAGRGEKKGEVYIQTYNSEHYSIEESAKSNYEGFYKKEIEIRRLLNYPPFSKILSINISSKNEKLLGKYAFIIGNLIKNQIENDKNVTMLGPTKSQIYKIKDFFRYQIIIKGEFTTIFSNNIKNIIYESVKEVYNNIRINLDINPNNFV